MSSIFEEYQSALGKSCKKNALCPTRLLDLLHEKCKKLILHCKSYLNYYSDYYYFLLLATTRYYYYYFLLLLLGTTTTTRYYYYYC